MLYETNPQLSAYDGINAAGLYFEFTDEYRAKIPFGLIPEQKKFNCVNPHYHQELEFIALTEGDLELDIDGESFFLAPGDCAVILPYAEHEGFCRIDNETTKYYCAKIDTRSFIPHGKSALGDEIRMISDCVTDSRRVIRSTEPAAAAVLSALKDLRYTTPSKPFTCDVKGQIMKLRAVYELLGVVIENKGGQRRQSRRNIDFIRACSDYISKNYASELTSRTLADAMGYELTHFCHLFSKNFGRNFSTYLRDYRIRSSLLFCGSGLPIAEIAARVGFGDYSYFSTEFKKAVGRSPRDFFAK